MVNLGNGEIEYKPVCAAAEFGDVKLAKMILDKGVDINSTVETIHLSVLDHKVGGSEYKCPEFKKKIKPSEWVKETGYKEAEKLLKAKKM
jgi:hypothetical protein